MRVNLSTRSGVDGIRMANSPGAIAGVTADDDVVAVLLDGDFGFDRIRVAENSVVQIGGMAQVEQIIDDELVVGANGDSVPLSGVHLRDIFEHIEVRHL